MENGIRRPPTPNGRYAHLGIAVSEGISSIYLAVTKDIRYFLHLQIRCWKAYV